jgi:hypothetical protein
MKNSPSLHPPNPACSFPHPSPPLTPTLLLAAGYYNDTIFHRSIKNFMIQGGDPTGTGRGGESVWGPAFDVSPAASALPPCAAPPSAASFQGRRCGVAGSRWPAALPV